MAVAEYLSESSELWDALRRSQRKIFVFLFTVTMIVVIVGAAMYLVEGPEHGFTSIPVSVYWAVVTLTTVGYGDISPQTPFGRFLAVFVTLIGYRIIAVPKRARPRRALLPQMRRESLTFRRERVVD